MHPDELDEFHARCKDILDDIFDVLHRGLVDPENGLEAYQEAAMVHIVSELHHLIMLDQVATMLEEQSLDTSSSPIDDDDEE